ncbi:hypothetical protein [Brachyspira hyodysenteriae]|uniref:hypothetical protein n=1 Tax=Brachyspira hyodysenteriae TaxID=159 RepID=UPI0020792ACB|nr:hypothetical protein [Brachyspira hyodysenteriae]MCZ9890109.1 hypothetical protein [Brachyspira hyodysenteriae]
MDIKRPYKYEEQLQKLKDRGCIINDDKKCISILESVNYYRFSAYFLPFKQIMIFILMVLHLKKFLIFMSLIENYILYCSMF